MPKRKSEIVEPETDQTDQIKPLTLTKRPRYAPTDEFQQVTKPSFVDRFRIKDLAHGDAFYQPEVIRSIEDRRYS